MLGSDYLSSVENSVPLILFRSTPAEIGDPVIGRIAISVKNHPTLRRAKEGLCHKGVDGVPGHLGVLHKGHVSIPLWVFPLLKNLRFGSPPFCGALQLPGSDTALAGRFILLILSWYSSPLFHHSSFLKSL